MAILQEGMFITGNMVHGYAVIDMSNDDDYAYRAYFTAQVDLSIDEDDDSVAVRGIDIQKTDVIYMPDFSWTDYELTGTDNSQVNMGLRDAITHAILANPVTVIDSYNEFA